MKRRLRAFDEFAAEGCLVSGAETAQKGALQSRSSAVGQYRTIIETLRIREAWLKDLLVGQATYSSEFPNWRIADVYCR
jgi:hypothetical protein